MNPFLLDFYMLCLENYQNIKVCEYVLLFLAMNENSYSHSLHNTLVCIVETKYSFRKKAMGIIIV